MTGAELVRARLLALSAVTAIVSTRVYLFAVPQTAQFPAVRVQRISVDTDAHLRGVGPMARERVQVDAIADTLSEALTLDAAMHGDGDGSRLAGFTGTVGANTVHAVLPLSAREFYEADEKQRFRVSRDYAVTWQ